MNAYPINHNLIQSIIKEDQILSYYPICESDDEIFILVSASSSSFLIQFESSTGFAYRKLSTIPTVPNQFKTDALYMFYRDSASNFTDDELKENILLTHFALNPSLQINDKMDCVDFVHRLHRP